MFRKRSEGNLEEWQNHRNTCFKKPIPEILCCDNVIARDSESICSLLQLREREVADLLLEGFRGDPA